MNNPVAWQLFGDEAIELAKKENKLLFISIGYSACHCTSPTPPFPLLIDPANQPRVPRNGERVL